MNTWRILRHKRNTTPRVNEAGRKALDNLRAADAQLSEKEDCWIVFSGKWKSRSKENDQKEFFHIMDSTG